MPEDGPKRILVVDDEVRIIELLQDVLGEHGYAVDGAVNATEAVELVRQRIYDAAILDFNLPDMDGLMLHRQIRQMDEELGTNTLFTSGYMQTDQNLGYYSAYGMGFLSKPFEVQEILDSLEALWSAAESREG